MVCARPSLMVYHGCRNDRGKDNDDNDDRKSLRLVCLNKSAAGRGGGGAGVHGNIAVRQTSP